VADPQEVPDRRSGLVEDVGQRPSERDDDVELTLGDPAGVGDIQEVAVLDGLLGRGNSDAGPVQLQLDRGQVGGDDGRPELSQRQREAAGPAPTSRTRSPRRTCSARNRVWSSRLTSARREDTSRSHSPPPSWSKYSRTPFDGFVHLCNLAREDDEFSVAGPSDFGKGWRTNAAGGGCR
jgi:hypothetical protein